MRMHNPPHPGGILKESLENTPISVTEFSAHIGVARGTLSRVLNERAGFTPEMSIRVSAALGQSPDLWYLLQTDYDFWQASQAKRRKIAPLKQIRMAKAA
jgi:addiction module HigA family antidote